jgi:hypothetical protein
MTFIMTILSNEARPANPDQLILGGLKKSARSYLKKSSIGSNKYIKDYGINDAALGYF